MRRVRPFRSLDCLCRLKPARHPVTQQREHDRGICSITLERCSKSAACVLPVLKGREPLHLRPPAGQCPNRCAARRAGLLPRRLIRSPDIWPAAKFVTVSAKRRSPALFRSMRRRD